MSSNTTYIDLVSISPTFYKQLLCQFPFAKKVQTWALSTKKLLERILYKKAARKMLVKLMPVGTEICVIPGMLSFPRFNLESIFKSKTFAFKAITLLQNIIMNIFFFNCGIRVLFQLFIVSLGQWFSIVPWDSEEVLKLALSIFYILMSCRPFSLIRSDAKY